MSFWKEAARRVSYLPFRSRFDRELDDELQFHIETRADELEQAGASRTAALGQARRELGPTARVREDVRSAWQFRWLEDLLADLRYAARGLRRNPAFALTAIACLGLGIGANTTMFSIAAEVLFSQPSVRDAQSVDLVNIGGNSHSPMYGYHFIREAGIFTDVVGENENMETNWRHGDATDRLFAILVTDNFFQATGVPLAMGRPILPGDSSAVVISYQLWQSRLGGDPNVIGRRLVLDGRPFMVSGVLPRDHRTLFGFGFAPDLYMLAPDDKRPVMLFARLPEGMTRQIAEARLLALCRQLDAIHPHEAWDQGVSVTATAGLARITGNQGTMAVAAFFAMLMVVVGLVLAIACANVASLLLARASSRSHELAIRLSIGAGRGRIIRHLFAESLLLALIGTAAGLCLNIGLTALLSRIRLPLPVPIQFVITPDQRLLGYSIATALGTSLVAGLFPAIRATRGGISTLLKQGERQISGWWSLRSMLVTGQLAISIVLLSAAVLFVRNLVDSATMNPGFDIQHTVWASMRLVPESYPDSKRVRLLTDDALERLRTIPGVEAASIAQVVPLNDSMNYQMSVKTDLDGTPHVLRWNGNEVGPDYFKTMRIPILAGREFLPGDKTGTQPVAIINQEMARALFGDHDPVGHVAWFGSKQPVQIAGVARNSKYMTLGEENKPGVYYPYAQQDVAPVNLHFLIRATGNPTAILSGVHTRLHGVDSTAALEVKTMQQGLGLALLPSRAGAIILGSMGLLGLALASIGLYGVLLYSVSRRVREIGLRMALGATPGAVLKLVVRQSASLTVVGVAIGLAISIFAVRPLAMFLNPEVHTGSPTNFVIVAAFLSAVAMAATVAPAVRAARVDPVVALRE
ncbi:MAG TPA: ABC transporter permease [Bryobacteraceae bacterium]|nr:ABC transporter permease [Bryobacteraceae bacterium]